MIEKRTKIICTIADNRCDADFIRQLYENGMNVVRINSAHASIEGAQQVVDNVRKVSDKIAILIDTKGPEVRLTQMADSDRICGTHRRNGGNHRRSVRLVQERCIVYYINPSHG